MARMNPVAGLLSQVELLLLDRCPQELSADEWSSTITLAISCELPDGTTSWLLCPEELRPELWRPLPGLVRVGYESLLTDRPGVGLAAFGRYSWKLARRAFGKARGLGQPARKPAPDSSSSKGADP